MKDGDARALETRVDWDQLRAGLRADLNAMVLQKLSHSGNSLASGLAVALAPAIVNQMIDGYITPQGMAALVGQKRQTKGSNTGDRSSGDRVDLSIIEYAFFDGGPLTFKVQLRNEKTSQDPFLLLFKWDGTWRLSRLMLPKEAFANALDKKPAAPSIPLSASSRIAGSSLVASNSSSAPVPLPSPFKVALTRKGFKSSDPMKSDFEDDITFSLTIENIGKKDIRAFDGTLTFTDLLDNEIHSSLLAINDRVSAGATLGWNGKLKFNQFMDSHQRLRNATLENLKIKFSPRKLLFEDGSFEQLSR
ncbi:DUF2939 domain-containing protein (plasmid) [Bradyrhizobium sp. CCGUVB1N3]|nr:DUF2939 domain-containing protein [Bradyrhizobium sp. CCGUVB1N3]